MNALNDSELEQQKLQLQIKQLQAKVDNEEDKFEEVLSFGFFIVFVLIFFLNFFLTVLTAANRKSQAQTRF